MDLKNYLNTRDITAKHAFVVGNPIEHSLSPLMHNTAAFYHNLDFAYYKLKLEEKDITQFISLLNHDTCLGCNITIPYKERFIEIVDELDSSVQSIGAMNTIVKQEGKLIGYNTDAYGFSKPLEPYTDEIQGSRVIVFGTGGASKACIFALSELDVSEIIWVSRNPGALERLKPEFAYTELILASYNNWQAYAEDNNCLLLVNTTPLGMWPNVDKSPVSDDDADLLQGKVCYDLVYKPENTMFLNQAFKARALPIKGLDMLIYQGSKAFEYWTNKSFPLELVRSKLNEQLQTL